MKSLVEHTLFEGLSPDQLQRILDNSSYRDLRAGEILIELNVTNSTLFVLYDGELNVILEDKGTNLVLPILPGDCIGEISLILERPTSAYAIAQKPSKVLLIPEEVFWNELLNTKQGVKNLVSIMTKRLRKNNQELSKRMEEQLHFQNMQKELDAAGKIQSNMIPDTGVLLARYPQVDVHGLLKQTAKVGGDFYDVLALDDNHIYFAIGDASGKGMTGALFMVRSLTALRMTVMNSPFEDLLPTVNKILLRNNTETMFISLFAGIINVKTGKLRYVNAGHNPTIGALGGNEFEILPMPRGSLLGVTDDNPFSVDEKELKSGDILVMYTDGVIEATGQDKRPFEEARLLHALTGANNCSMRQLVTYIDDTITKFVSGAPQYDDITILAIKYLGP